MLRYVSLGLSLVVFVQAAEPKISNKQGRVAVDSHGEVQNIRDEEKKEKKIEKKEPDDMAAGFHVRTTATEKRSENKGVKEHKPVAPAEKTVRADAAVQEPAQANFAAPAEDPVAQSAPEDQPAPAPAPEQKSQDAPSNDAPAESEPAPAVSAEPAKEYPYFAAEVFVTVTLVAAFCLIAFILRDRIVESLPAPVQESVATVRQQLGLETALRESRPTGPRKKMGIERSESSQEYSSMRSAAYADQSEYLSPVQSETSSTSEGEVPTGRA